MATDLSDEADVKLAGFLDAFLPEIAERARDCRAALRRRMPTAIELVYDNYQALAIGYAASEKQADCVVSLAIFPAKVSLSFYNGAALADPVGRLQGEGKQNRFIRLTGADTLADQDVGALIATALEQAPRPLPEPGTGGYTVIKSVSAKQRPRRPT